MQRGSNLPEQISWLAASYGHPIGIYLRSLNRHDTGGTGPVQEDNSASYRSVAVE
jgi:hypothetical protein